MSTGNPPRANVWQQVALVVLRTAIGWHFLYEGWVKITDPTWSAAAYLQMAQGPLAGFFRHLAESPRLLWAVDLANAWGLTALGLLLVLGLFARPAAAGAMLMLALYYLANPPWIAVLPQLTEGNYLVVDKNLVELVALGVVLAFDTGGMAGMDVLAREWGRRLLRRRAARAASAPAARPGGEQASC